VNPTFRKAACLLVAVTSFILAQTASAAGLGLSVDVQGDTLAASADIAAPAAEASVEASADLAAPSASATVDTGTATARVDVAAGPPAVSGPPGSAGRAREDPGTPTRSPDHRDRVPRGPSIVASASSGSAVHRPEPPAPLTAGAAQTRSPLGIDLAPLPERSSNGWGASLQAAAVAVSGSPAALVGLLLIVVLLMFRPVLGAVSAPRPSLHSFVLQRPG
jgi:hypothetical protein